MRSINDWVGGAQHSATGVCGARGEICRRLLYFTLDKRTSCWLSSPLSPCSINDWVGGAERNATGVSGAGAKIAADFMADGGTHSGDFLYASGGLRGLLQNG